MGGGSSSPKLGANMIISNTITLFKVNKAVKAASKLDIIPVRKYNLKHPGALLTNSAEKNTAVEDIPTASQFIILDQNYDTKQPVRLIICMRKMDKTNLFLGVIEIITPKRWKNIKYAEKYLNERMEWAKSNTTIKLNQISSTVYNDPMFVSYAINIEAESVRKIAEIVETLKEAVRKSVRLFNK